MQKVIGGILHAVGILIAGLSGLCSLIFFLTEVTSPHSQLGDLIGMIAVFGGIPFAIGVGLFHLGRFLVRTAEAG